MELGVCVGGNVCVCVCVCVFIGTRALAQANQP